MNGPNAVHKTVKAKVAVVRIDDQETSESGLVQRIIAAYEEHRGRTRPERPAQQP